MMGYYRRYFEDDDMDKTQLRKKLKDDFWHLYEDQVFGLTIYGEARGESRDGKIAVGSVILERVDHRDWDGKTIKEVCLMPYQFSCYLPADPNYYKLLMIAQHWDDSFIASGPLYLCFAIARGMMDGKIPRTPEIAANHCCQYATQRGTENVTWDDKMKLVAKINHHLFYA